MKLFGLECVLALSVKAGRVHVQVQFKSKISLATEHSVISAVIHTITGVSKPLSAALVHI